jgi:tRNA (guanine-N7-)-methyltransferase
MNNPTPAYAALVTQRRDAVRVRLDQILAANPTFLWEVGSGHGHFLTAYAAKHPEKICIGVDLVGERVERATRKRDRAALPNLHFIRAEARLFLNALPPAAQISEVFILFPDPWPKLRHHKHRVLQPEFLAAIAPHAAPGCRIYFRTDYQPYFEDARRVISGSPHWELVETPWPFEFETVFQSRADSYGSAIAQLRPSAA